MEPSEAQVAPMEDIAVMRLTVNYQVAQSSGLSRRVQTGLSEVEIDAGKTVNPYGRKAWRVPNLLSR